ncbi:MAG: family 78 glycoside hydrolase catalytic domain [Acidobacteria bacterium]|nr:family 78 glycoside hydrolase catalytic domain [Acidobacteriota bacterium]
MLSWVATARNANLRGLNVTRYRVIVASSPAELIRNEGDLWDSGEVNAKNVFQSHYAGKPLRAAGTYWWKVQLWDQSDAAGSWSELATFTMGLQPDDWKAHWITADAHVLGTDPQKDAAAVPIFRHTFQTSGVIKRAILFVSGLGQYEALVNGQPVTDSVLNPGWTNYHKTILYNEFDVTNKLKIGRNAISVLLGNGMYNVPHTPNRYQKLQGSFGPPKLIAQMILTHADGSEEIVATDGSWKTSKSPVTFSSTYGGEDYDARVSPGWEQPGFDDAKWAQAKVVDGPGGQLKAQQIPSIKPIQTYRTVKVTTPKPGVTVYDLGQNFSGWPEISVRGPRGSSVKLIPGELLTDDGLVTQRSFDGPVWFTYTLAGQGIEHWHPRFTYSGFRYVQVETTPASGSTALPQVASMTGVFVHSSARPTGTFQTSNSLFNRIHKLIDVAIESNMQSVLTDCPHREKLGWLEQTHLMGPGIFYGYDVHNLYQKMSADMQDSQLPSGLVPEIAPEYAVFENGFRDSPEWGSAVILSPWTDYRFTRDLDLLRNHYEQMQKYLDFLHTEAKDGILSEGLGDWYDMGPKPPGYAQLTGMKVTATAIYYRDLSLMSQIASLLGKTDDAARYSSLASEVGKSYNRDLLHSDTNQYDTGSQTANAISLAVGLVPGERRQAVVKNLVADVRSHQNHVTAGDIGFHYVLESLNEGGHSDVICDMLSRTDPPSYGYQLKMGATALTEAWNSDPTSSQNHFMLGHAEEWFYRGLAGLDFDLSRPDGEQLMFKPEMVCGISSASASYDSLLGRISIAWHRIGERTTIDAVVPPGMTAVVRIPGQRKEDLQESGDPIEASKGVSWLRSDGGYQFIRVASGTYHLESQSAPVRGAAGAVKARD